MDTFIIPLESLQWNLSHYFLKNVCLTIVLMLVPGTSGISSFAPKVSCAYTALESELSTPLPIASD
jgi:hypothetical protein